MEAIEIIVGIQVLNERSKNVGIIPAIGGDAHILDDGRVLVLRLVNRGKFTGLYTAAYWKIDNIRDISKKSSFSLADVTSLIPRVDITHH